MNRFRLFRKQIEKENKASEEFEVRGTVVSRKRNTCHSYEFLSAHIYLVSCRYMCCHFKQQHILTHKVCWNESYLYAPRFFRPRSFSVLKGQHLLNCSSICTCGDYELMVTTHRPWNIYRILRGHRIYRSGGGSQINSIFTRFIIFGSEKNGYDSTQLSSQKNNERGILSSTHTYTSTIILGWWRWRWRWW